MIFIHNNFQGEEILNSNFPCIRHFLDTSISNYRIYRKSLRIIIKLFTWYIYLFIMLSIQLLFTYIIYSINCIDALDYYRYSPNIAQYSELKCYLCIFSIQSLMVLHLQIWTQSPLMYYSCFETDQMYIRFFTKKDLSFFKHRYFNLKNTL